MTSLQPLAYCDSSDPSRDLKGEAALKRTRPHGHDIRGHTAGVLLMAICLAGCARAPSFDVLGSFFPAWLLCLGAGVLLSFTARWLLARLGIVIAAPILTYPCLTALFACSLWLVFFQQ